MQAEARAAKDDYCKVGGTSWLYALEYRSGAPVSTQNVPVASGVAGAVRRIGWREIF